MLLCVFLCFEVALNLDEFRFRVDTSVDNQSKLFLVLVFDDINVLPRLVFNFFTILLVFS